MKADKTADGASEPRLRLTPAGKTGAGLFGLWGVLHLWVGIEGLHQYFSSPARGQWEMFIGGSRAPTAAFIYPIDAITIHAQANIVLNFCLDVAGYGVLGITVAWLLYRRPSLTAYLLGLIIVGICDVSFTFLQLTSGVIKLSLPSTSGPILWLIASIITPFGIRRMGDATLGLTAERGSPPPPSAPRRP